MTDVSVIVVNYNTEHLLEKMFGALYAACGELNVETIVVDNASQDGSVQLLRTRYPEVELLVNEENVGFGRANNQAVARARGRYVLLLNTDAFVAPDTLVKTVEYMDANARCGVLGVKLVGSEGQLQPSCRFFPTPWNVFLSSTRLQHLFPSTTLVDDMKWDHESTRECDWVPGCYYLVRKEVVAQVGLFDPRYFLYCEEVDHSRAVQAAGWSIVFFPFTQVVHIGGESALSVGELTSMGKQIGVLQVESELLYYRKHHGLLGVVAHVFLQTVVELSNIGKGFFRRVPLKSLELPFRNIWNTGQIFWATRFASRPTR